MTTNKRCTSSAWRHQPALYRGGNIRPGADRCTLIRNREPSFQILTTEFLRSQKGTCFLWRRLHSPGSGSKHYTWYNVCIKRILIFCCQHLIPLVIASLSIWCWKVCLLFLLPFLLAPFLGRERISDFGSASRLEQEKQKNTLRGESWWCHQHHWGCSFQRQWLWSQCHTQCPERAAEVAQSTRPCFTVAGMAASTPLAV